MSNLIKQFIFRHRLNKCHRRYEQTAEKLRDPYQQWIAQNESKQKTGKRNVCKFQIEDFSLTDFAEMIKGKTDAAVGLPDDWFSLCLCEGIYSMPTADWEDCFAKKTSIGLIYADEDMTDESSGARYGAWFKPDYSPDTLLSFFYFGSLLFLNGKVVKRALREFGLSLKEDECNDRQCLYDFILFYTEFLQSDGLQIKHIPQVLFHGKGEKYQPEDPQKPEVVNENAYWGFEPAYDVCKLAAIKRRGYSAHMKETEHAGKKYHIPVYDIEKKSGHKPLVSVIIPSKDNPEVLETCIRSIYEKTAYSDYEVVVVDNGSSEENRAKIDVLKDEYGFRYLYEPMEFNFSKMCNLGVSASKGAYILLLNDDMEILQPDWLDIMVGQAGVDGVGAVGAKLLYPDSDIIQHVGISSMWDGVGPSHKLLKEHDSGQDYYYGRNVLPYDMIGVTAACLMVSRVKYSETGGFSEDIAVSYNDVDFCFTLYDLGYRNVIRNDVVLYHHESLSRGNDAVSDIKWERLLSEKKDIYERHPRLKGNDPYYNPNLAGYKHKYFCNYLYPYEKSDCYNQIKHYKGNSLKEWNNECLIITLEHARLARRLNLNDEKKVYWLEGWAYVLNMDSSRYKRTLLLIDEAERMYEVSVFDRYRQDVVDILPEQVNVGLSGFSCRIKREDLPQGEYRVALLYRDMCSRQRLYRECDKKLIVE